MNVHEALRLTRMQYSATGGGDDPQWLKFRQTMTAKSRSDPLELFGPLLNALCRDLGQCIYADCEAEELVIVYYELQPFGRGLDRRIGAHSFEDLRRIQKQWDREGRH